MKLRLSHLLTLLLLCFSVSFTYAGFPLKAVPANNTQQYTETHAHRSRLGEKVSNFVNNVRERFAAIPHDKNYGTLALIYGLLGVLVFPPLSIAGIIYGAMGMKAGGSQKGTATAGFVLGIIGAVYLLVMLGVLALIILAYL